MTKRFAVALAMLSIAMSSSGCATSPRSGEVDARDGIDEGEALILAKQHVRDAGLTSQVFMEGHLLNFFSGPKVKRWDMESCRECWGAVFTPRRLSRFPVVYIVLIDSGTGEIRKAVWEK